MRTYPLFLLLPNKGIKKIHNISKNKKIIIAGTIRKLRRNDEIPPKQEVKKTPILALKLRKCPKIRQNDLFYVIWGVLHALEAVPSQKNERNPVKTARQKNRHFR